MARYILVLVITSVHHFHQLVLVLVLGFDLEGEVAPLQFFAREKQAQRHYPTCPFPQGHERVHPPLDQNIMPIAPLLLPQHKTHFSPLKVSSSHLLSNPKVQQHVPHSAYDSHISTRAYLYLHISNLRVVGSPGHKSVILDHAVDVLSHLIPGIRCRMLVL